MSDYLRERIGRVMVVEDEEIARMLAKAWLLDRGLKVYFAQCEAEVRALLARHRFRLILMDIDLPPHEDGCVIAKSLSEDPATAYVPIVGITAHVSPEVQARAVDAGILACFSKPLTKRTADKICERYLLPRDPE